MEVYLGCASAQQIDSVAPQLAGAGSSEDELLSGLSLNKQMHNFQQSRKFLHLIDDNLRFVSIAFDELDQALGPSRQLAVDLRVQQVNPQRLRVVMD
jgi:hypothetical protein